MAKGPDGAGPGRFQAANEACAAPIVGSPGTELEFAL